MRLLTFVTKGKARISDKEVRCAAPRKGEPHRLCNKLLAKKNKEGQIAGNFRCERCRQDVEIRLAPPAEYQS